MADNKVEIARQKLELVRVSAARAELEFIILQREEEIERVRANIAIQEAKEAEVRAKLAELGA